MALNIPTTETAIASLETTIRSAIKERIKQIVDEETEKAIAGIKDRIADQVDAIALRLAKHYDIQSMGDRIIIEVRKQNL